MAVNLRGKNFLELEKFTPEEIKYLLDLAHQLKSEKYSGINQKRFNGKNLLMLFEMGSTRTRCACETSACDLGMGTTYLANSHFGVKETVKDSMRVFSGMYDAIVYRGENHANLMDMAKDCSIPLINGFTVYQHPTQMLADFMTMEEIWGRNGYKDKTFCFVGNGICGVALSYSVMCALLGMNFKFVGPKNRGLNDEEREMVKGLFARYSPNNTFFESENIENVFGADIISTENWGNFTAPVETWIPGIKEFRPYQVNTELLEKTGNKDVIVMHMLPSSHNCGHQAGQDLVKLLDKETANFISKGLEVTDEVFENNANIIFKEAENRQHSIKAVLHAVVGV